MAKSYEKLIEEIAQMPAIELAGLVKALEEKFGVSAAMPVGGAVAAAEAAPAAAEEKNEYKVTLKDGGPEKIKTIKALRSVLPTLPLPDAKKAVEEAPTVLAEAASKADAKKIKEELEKVGAKIELS
jgi:large subunit ribosomal protein L7/L12